MNEQTDVIHWCVRRVGVVGLLLDFAALVL